MALRILYQIEVEGAYANLALNKGLRHSGLNKADRGLATELVYGSVRSMGTLDWVIAQKLTRPLKQLTPWIRNILRLGAYQLLYLDRIPPAAVCNEATELAKKFGHRGTAGLVNGVLRNIARDGAGIFPPLESDPVRHIALRHSHPEWMVRRWLQRFGTAGTIELCIANNQQAPTVVRVNTLKTTKLHLEELLTTLGVVTESGQLAPEALFLKGVDCLDRLPPFQEGMMVAQDEASMLVAHVLNPPPGTLVLDACAAPGSKTTHIAQLMENRGRITALDIHSHKLGLIRGSVMRLGITCVDVQKGDARQADVLFPSGFDYILVDAPCSGTGVLRRRADARWRKDPERLQQLVELQREILQGAYRALRPGGVLVYSTCSIEPEENGQNLTWLMEQYRDLTLEDLTPYLPMVLAPSDLVTAQKGYLQLLPHIHGTDGFFIARLRKQAG